MFIMPKMLLAAGHNAHDVGPRAGDDLLDAVRERFAVGIPTPFLARPPCTTVPVHSVRVPEKPGGTLHIPALRAFLMRVLLTGSPSTCSGGDRVPRRSPSRGPLLRARPVRPVGGGRTCESYPMTTSATPTDPLQVPFEELPGDSVENSRVNRIT